MQLTDALKEQLNDIYIEDRLTPYFALHADTYLQIGKIDFAIGVLEEGLKEHANDAIAHYLLGKAYLEKDNLSSAKAELERAVKLAPFMTNALRYLLSIAQKEKMSKLEELYSGKLRAIEPFVFSDEKMKIIVPKETTDIESSFEVVEDNIEPEAATLKSTNTEDKSPELDAENVDHVEDETSFIDTIETDTMIEELWEDLNAEEDEETDVTESGEVSEAVDEEIATIEPSKETKPAKKEKDTTSASFAKVPDSAASPMVDDDLLGDELDILSSKKVPAKPKAKSAIVSPTLGEIYLAQGQYADAKEIFVQLLANDPDNPKLQRKLSDIEALLNA